MRFVLHELKMNLKSLLIWTFVVGGMIFVFMLMFPSIEESAKEISDAYSQMGAFSVAFGMDRIDMGTPMGFFGVEIGAVLALGGSMFAAITGIGMLAKEEGGHTTEFLYVTPNKRNYFITSKLVAGVIIIAIFTIICMLMGCFGFLAIGEKMEWNKYLLYIMSQFFMYIQITGICFGISAFLRKNNIGLGIGIAMLLYFTNLFANISEDVEKLHYITPFSYSDAADIFIDEKIKIEFLIPGMVIMIVVVAMGYIKYNRKDLSI